MHPIMYSHTKEVCYCRILCIGQSSNTVKTQQLDSPKKLESQSVLGRYKMYLFIDSNNAITHMY